MDLVTTPQDIFLCDFTGVNDDFLRSDRIMLILEVGKVKNMYEMMYK